MKRVEEFKKCIEKYGLVTSYVYESMKDLWDSCEALIEGDYVSIIMRKDFEIHNLKKGCDCNCKNDKDIKTRDCF